MHTHKMRDVAIERLTASLGSTTSAQAIAAVYGNRLDSIKHPALALARLTRTEGGRRDSGAYAVHGPVLLRRALDAQAPIVCVLYSPAMLSDPTLQPLVQQLVERRVPHASVSEGTMRGLVQRAYVPEVITLLLWQAPDLSSIVVHANSLFVLADAIANPSNLGMLVRTAYGCGAEALLLTRGSCDALSWQVSTGSTGALFHLPIVQDIDIPQLQSWREAGVRFVAATPTADRSYTELAAGGPMCVMVGNEAEGLSPAATDLATESVRIPMAHALDSLNVAVAAGIILFEIRRQIQHLAEVTQGR